MDLRKMVLGLTTLAIVAGLLLVCFAPGGWFNKGQTEKAAFKTPVGSFEITAQEAKSSVWPTWVMYCSEWAASEWCYSYYEVLA
jgi:hypothetical protein